MNRLMPNRRARCETCLVDVCLETKPIQGNPGHHALAPALMPPPDKGPPDEPPPPSAPAAIVAVRPR
jgi:hypothetical protein